MLKKSVRHNGPYFNDLAHGLKRMVQVHLVHVRIHFC